MGNPVDAIVDAVSQTIDAVYDIVKSVWDEVAMPILEQVFAFLGIEDETVVEVQRVSSLIYKSGSTSPITSAQIKAILSMSKNDGGFYLNYQQYVSESKAMVHSFYRYGKRGIYTYGLPDLNVKGKQINLVAVKDAVDIEFTVDSVVTFAKQRFPSDYEHFQNALQTSPENYDLYTNTLTYPDSWGVDRTWTFDSVTDNTTDYSINISRTADRTYLWIYGPETVVEGDTATFTVYANRTVPSGKSLTVNFTYSGTAVNGTDYTQSASAIIAAGTSEVDVNIATLERAGDNGARNFTIIIDSVDNSTDVFDYPVVHANDSVTCSIVDDDVNSGKVLTMPHGMVNESDTSITIPVTLNAAAAGAFTVDYDFNDITAIGLVGGGAGSDYDSTPGTLNFTGAAGEVQNIVVPITADIADDDQEQFQIVLQNCSDATINLTNTKVTIWDGTNDPAPDQTTVSTSFTEALFTNKEYLIVHYYVGSASNASIWHYDVSLGTYPDAEFKNQTLSNLEMLPVALLRQDKVSLAPSDPAYESTEKLLSALGLDLASLIENVEANPDISSIDSVYINFALSPNLAYQSVSKILFKTFYQLHIVNSLTSGSEEYHAVFKEGDIQTALVWTKYAWNPSKAGNAGDDVGVTVPYGRYYHRVSGTNLVLRFQDTETTYAQLLIYNLNGMAAIEYDGYHKAAFTKLGDNTLTVPISYFVFRQLKPEEALEIYEHMLRIDVHAITITELEWYETSAFRNLFNFALIVINVITLGTASSFTSFLYYLAVNYVIALAVVRIAELTGNAELAALVGVVAAIALSSSGTIPLGNMTTAESVLNITTNFADDLANVYTDEAKQLQKDMNELNKQAQANIKSANKFVADQEMNAQFLNTLRSVDTNLYIAQENQYNFDQLYDYNTYIGNVYANALRSGIV